MNKIKYFLIPVFSCLFFMLSICTVKAEGYYTLIDFKEDTEEYITSGGLAYDATSALKNWIHRGFQSVGFIIDEVQDTLGIKRAINQVDSTINDNSSDEEVNEWIRNNLTVSGNNVEFSNDLRQSIYNYASDYSSENPAYCYSYGLFEISGNNYLPRNTGVFRSVSQYEKALDLIKGAMPGNVINYDKNNLWWINNPSSGYQMLYRFDLTQHPYLILKPRDSGTITDRFIPNFIDGYTNTTLTSADYAYKWNGTDWEPQEATSFNNNTNRYITLSKNPKRESSDWAICINYISRAYRFYPRGQSVNAQDILTQPYYYNNDVWNDFSSTTGDYVVTDENINTVTYGDTVNYINSFNTENGYPPSSSDININIENINDENKNPSGGGGSGGDDNGGGSGGSGPGNDGIFDFLSDLGSVLGNLIKNLGQAITNIISGVADLVSSIITDLPTVFFDFLGAIFGWLPEEWVTLLSLSLACMLIWGIVKVIRG